MKSLLISFLSIVSARGSTFCTTKVCDFCAQGEVGGECVKLLKMRNCCQVQLTDTFQNILRGDMVCTKECFPMDMAYQVSSRHPSPDVTGLKQFLDNVGDDEFCDYDEVPLCRLRYVSLSVFIIGSVIALVVIAIYYVCTRDSKKAYVDGKSDNA